MCRLPRAETHTRAQGNGGRQSQDACTPRARVCLVYVYERAPPQVLSVFAEVVRVCVCVCACVCMCVCESVCVCVCE
jgi:hypothetical protein